MVARKKNILYRIPRLFRANNSYRSGDYYYKILFNKYEKLDSYLSLTDLQNKQALLTDEDISFSDNQKFKKNEMKYLKKKYGKPDHIIVNNYAFGKIKIYFYRIHLGIHKVKMELHFFQDSLFMYNYTFSYLKNESEKIEILNLLKEKYQIDKGKDIVTHNYYIIDKKKSVIVLSENFDLTINYILDINFNLFHQINDNKNEKIEKGKQIANQNKREIYRSL